MHAFHKFGVLFFLRFEYLLLLQPSFLLSNLKYCVSQGAQIAPHPQVHPHTPQSNKKLNYTFIFTNLNHSPLSDFSCFLFHLGFVGLLWQLSG